MTGAEGLIETGGLFNLAKKEDGIIFPLKKKKKTARMQSAKPQAELMQPRIKNKSELPAGE